MWCCFCFCFCFVGALLGILSWMINWPLTTVLLLLEVERVTCPTVIGYYRLSCCGEGICVETASCDFSPPQLNSCLPWAVFHFAEPRVKEFDLFLRLPWWVLSLPRRFAPALSSFATLTTPLCSRIGERRFHLSAGDIATTLVLWTAFSEATCQRHSKELPLLREVRRMLVCLGTNNVSKQLWNMSKI